ncbi:hypothetical protein A2Y85_02335 [candidate division WOR-3 bacterium RBG_13_43_14]|uniref:Uncharacterized protein n=1 Tax=candidate division WOR-3 bacterium RBG_13_43_14 TaxID=1802590 RepID=A0A1F4UD86_UNCW3|nr:MAG: hypothetical protein A2Y85_02335 [candidate division WOR-3 bacterium RBG_13_43_14]
MKLLCDAVVVIDAHKINKWQYLTSAHHIFLGSIVAHKECIFYIDNYQKQTIDFALDEKNGKVRILTATAKEISKVAEKVSKYKLIIDP